MRMRSNEEWLRALRADGVEQQEALEDLRERLLWAVLDYLAAHRVSRALFDQEEARQLAEDCAQEALLAILEKLETFRGESRFTTWAYAVTIRLVLGALRRRRWKEVSLDQSRIGEELPAWPIEDAKSPDPERALQQEEVWRIDPQGDHRKRAHPKAAVCAGRPRLPGDAAGLGRRLAWDEPGYRV